MVAIPSEAEEDQRRPGRDRERLVSERIALEDRMQNLLCLHGVSSFKPRLKKAAAQLAALRRFDGEPLPTDLMAELRRLLARHQLLSEQLTQIEAAREKVLATETPDIAAQQIRALVILYRLGLGTATDLSHEVFCRSFRDRQALASPRLHRDMLGRPDRNPVQQRRFGARAGDQQERQPAGSPAADAVGPPLRRGRLWWWLRLQPVGDKHRVLDRIADRGAEHTVVDHRRARAGHRGVDEQDGTAAVHFCEVRLEFGFGDRPRQEMFMLTPTQLSSSRPHAISRRAASMSGRGSMT
jgi:hypothetical protein